MAYLTSWDINLFLCFLSFDIPWCIAKEMVKSTKKIHESYILESAREFHCGISPSLLYTKYKMRRWVEAGSLVLAKTSNKFIEEFKLAWQWRCPEVRRDLIYRTILFQSPRYMDRLKYDFNWHTGRYRIDSEKELPIKGRHHSSEGLWNMWSAWSDYHNRGRLRELEELRYESLGNHLHKHTKYISDWYGNIHEGRYFLFFRDNSITGFGKRGNNDKKLLEKVKRFASIHNIGPFQQMAEDLLVIDGPGLGKSGSKIDHIDDIFVV